MHIERGSTWNRWDFHVHTPYSILNNQFGFDPDPNYQTDVAEFDEYVKKLFENAVDKEIAAIGVTDYFSIDGYKRIRQEYLDRPEKMIELFPDEAIRSSIEQIYLFPNIEFRIENLIEQHPVNYHVILSAQLPIIDIEEGFLQRLEISHETGNVLPLTRNNIERIGREYKQHNVANGTDYHVGLNRTVVDYKTIYKVLNESATLKDQYFIAIPVDEDLSQVDWCGHYYQTRKILYHQADLLLSSNARTRRWALAKGNEKQQIDEFRSIKPCIWGSDAHSYDKMFCPDQGRFCWVKAQPTFEGMQQILYEPADRVRIQKDKPEEKDEHQLIDYIVFHDDRFEEQPVYLSEGLTAIIGGKSTGKSILLRHIAIAVDSKQVHDREKQPYLNTSPKLEATAEVFWRDGVSGERKIIYIPQSWLNRVVDETGGDSQLNTMIRGILLQQPSIQSAHDVLEERISEILAAVKRNIADYVSHVEQASICETQLSEHGRSVAFKSSIKKFEKQREELSTEAGITDEILERYSTLEKQIEEQTGRLSSVEKEEPHLNFLNEPFVYIPDFTDIGFDGNHSYDLSALPTVKEIIDQAIEQINVAIIELWNPAIQRAENALAAQKKDITDALSEINKNFEPLKQIVAKNDQLKKIDNQLKEERQRLQRALELEGEKASHLLEADKLKKQILSSREDLLTAYREFSQKLSELNSSDTDLKFIAKIEDRRKELFDAINGLFDNRNLRSFREAGYSVTEAETLKIDNGLFEALWKGMSNGSLGFKGGSNLRSALEKLFSDWFYIHFIVSSGEDTINNMSPGKKALVLLELIVNLEKGQCPILIDQPEDDLDNRSIYTDLVKYLKDKKHERQIIVVTHNANVVVGADAEEVIIANQEGKEAENYCKRFEYRCGPIENVTPIYEDGVIRKGILNQKGIQEQICDILEGGKDAFEKRASKYFSTT